MCNKVDAGLLSNKRNRNHYGIVKGGAVLVEKELFGLDRDELCAKLGAEGIFARKYFYPLVSENREFSAELTEGTPKAKYYSRNILCLPLYAHLDVADVDRIWT